jgi:hypothetical protein
MTWRRVGNDVAQRPLLPRQSETIEKVIDNGYADDKGILGLFCLSAPLSQVLPGIGSRFAGTCIRPVLVERTCSKGRLFARKLHNLRKRTCERFSRTDV